MSQVPTLARRSAIEHYDLGNALIGKGQYADAIECFRRSLKFEPDFAEARNNLGSVLLLVGEVDPAIECFRQAVEFKPQHAQAHFNLGYALTFKGDTDGVIACYRQALAVNPGFSEASNNLGIALRDIGQLDEAIACHRLALATNPRSINAHNSLLMALHGHPISDFQSIYLECERWHRQHIEPLQIAIKPHFNNRTPTRRLRVGYVSSDFRDHPVGRFLLPLLSSHDRSAFQVFCYANVSPVDEMTRKLQAHADVWRNIAGVCDLQAAAMIRQDGIDILVDLGMHTSNNRLLIFAYKPAPIQVTYLAYAGGTAMKTIDYRLTDQYLDPSEANDQYYMEKSIRLDGTYWCYQPSNESPPAKTSPAAVSGMVTFGSLNSFAKITHGTWETWSKLLQTLPNTRLLLHTPTGSHRETVKTFLQSRGISSERLEMVGRMTAGDYFQTYQRLDIALDPFPFAGATTTCDALWMGVPVVTLAGGNALGRAGASILANAGLQEFVAHSRERYVQIAANLASDRPRLAELRSTLRQRMQHSALMDSHRFAKGIESAYWMMWQRWCDKGSA